MSAKLYARFPEKALNKEIGWDSDDVRVMLLGSGYVPNQNTHQYLSDVVASQVTGTGYTAGGNAIPSRAFDFDAATRTTILRGADVTWANSTITARYAVIFDNTPGTNGTKPLIGFVDFTTDQASTAGNFVITWDASGIVRLTVA
jgi:hypothetical protein